MINNMLIVINSITFDVYYDGFGIIDIMLPSDSEGINLLFVLGDDVLDAIRVIVSKGDYRNEC